jgi:hypothetical protein
VSNFNDANELASNLVFGTNYHNNKPIPNRPKRLVFTLLRKIVVTAEAETREEFAKVAGEIQDVLDEGFRLQHPTIAPEPVDVNFMDEPHARELPLDIRVDNDDRNDPPDHDDPRLWALDDVEDL